MTTPSAPTTGQLVIMAASRGNNLRLAQLFHKIASSMSISSVCLDLVNEELPLYSSDAEKSLTAGSEVDQKIQKLHATLSGASMLGVCAPEYNGGPPPSLNNALSWISRRGKNWRDVLAQKPMFLSTHSGGAGHHLLSSLRLQFSYCGALVLGNTLSVSTTKNPEKTIEAILLELKQLAR